MPTAPTPIDPVPTPVPTTDDPGNFDARADAMLGWFPDGIDQINDLGANVYANAQEVATAATDITALAALAAEGTQSFGYSTSTLVVSAGTKTVHLTAPKTGFPVNERVVIISRADPTIRLFGTIAGSPTPTTTDFAVTVVSSGVIGSGSYSDWIVMSAAFLAAAATAADILAASSDAASVTPKAMKEALAPYALTDGATVTPDGLNGIDFTWTIGGNRTLGAITNTYPGARGSITVTQDGTGSRILAVASVWKRVGGLAVLSTAPGAIDELQYEVKTVDGSGTATRIVYGLMRGAS